MEIDDILLIKRSCFEQFSNESIESKVVLKISAYSRQMVNGKNFVLFEVVPITGKI